MKIWVFLNEITRIGDKLSLNNRKNQIVKYRGCSD